MVTLVAGSITVSVASVGLLCAVGVIGLVGAVVLCFVPSFGLAVFLDDFGFLCLGLEICHPAVSISSAVFVKTGLAAF